MPAKDLSVEKQTLLALRALRQRVEELEDREREPIAIIGMACRFPGGATTPGTYWDLLAEGRDAVAEIPPQRMDIDSIFDSRPQTPGKTYSRWAGLLDAPGDFDAEFFGISPREAVGMDPQQRLLLEVSWEALENACIDPRTLAGQSAGVFVGITTSEYAQLLQRNLPPDQLTAHVLQGSALNATAGRLSYFYGLQGPSMAIDSACSSSLVATDRACRSLREAETRLAIAAGVNVLAVPESLIIASQWGMLSPHGRIRAFDGEADGFVRGEGCGVLVLKRLVDAEADGDRILGVILGSAVNQDGASSGLTVPNGLAQQELLRAAYRRSGIEPWQVGYVEAHGTGTTLGDPIEAEALGAVFAGKRAKKLLIGSVKTNVGHLESAAGVAGLIKVVLGLEHGVVPGQLHWERPSEHVRWDDLPLEVVTKARPWEPIEGRRIAGVSSFGFSGTNAHVVVEGREEEAQPAEAEPREEVLVIAARTEVALRALAERYAEFLAETESGWSAICWTAAIGRAVFGERLAVVASGKAEAAEKLSRWQRGEFGPGEQGAGESGSGVYRGTVRAGQRAEAVTAAGLPEAVAERFVRGGSVDWTAVAAGRKLPRVALPGYAFQRERYWIDVVERPASGEPTGRALLGHRLRAAGVAGQYEAQLRASSWIGEHVVEGRVVLPATGHLELMLEAGAELSGPGCMLEDVVLQAPLEIEGERRVQTVVEEAAGGRSRVRVYAEQSTGGWQRVSEGWLRSGLPAEGKPEQLDVESIRSRLRAAAAGEEFYAQMAARGLQFGPQFRSVERAWTGTDEALGEIALAESGAAAWELEPWWLDACLQVAGLAAGDNGESGALYLPLSIDRLQVYARPAGRTWSHVRMQRIDADTVAADITITDADGHPLVQISRLRFRKLKPKSADVGVYSVEWIEAPLQAAPLAIKGHWVVLSDDNDFGAEVCGELQKQGATWSLISGARFIRGLAVDAPLSGAWDWSGCRGALRSILAVHPSLEGVLDLRAAATKCRGVLEEAGGERQILQPLDDWLSLLQALLLEQIHPARYVWIVTRAGQAEAGIAISAAGRAVQALRRTATLEFPEPGIRSLDISQDTDANDLLHAITVVDAEEMVLRGELILAPRLTKGTAPAEAPNRELVPAGSGLIEDLQSVSVPRSMPREDEVEIASHVHGLNFRDVMVALGMLPGTVQRLGGECAGSVVQAGKRSGFAVGERVFAFAAGGFRQYVTVKDTNVARVPDDLSLAQAAALPIVYLTALYGLDRLAALQAGESILIHAAAGGLGLAAVHLARSRGARIYATAGSEEKRAYLRSQGIEHVLPSRTAEFAEEVMRLTGGRGVDVVLNSLTGALAEKTLSVMARDGRFLEVGKRETLTRETVARGRPDVRYFVYDLGEEAAADTSLVPSLLREILRLLASNAIPPLPVTEFTDPKDAFSYMAHARHIGKIVVCQSDPSLLPGTVKPDAQATYLITGGCGSLGLLFAEKLVERGARHLVLMGRSAPGASAVQAMQKMRSRGADVRIENADVADRTAVEAVLREIPSSHPLKGILHAAGVLDDHSLLEQTPASLLSAMLPKWIGAWNLHALTRDQGLDFFVLFSSAAVVLGSPGQANYAAANAMLDALADHRRQLGLPSLSVQWGPWNSEGMTRNLKTDLQSVGMATIDPAAGVVALDRLLAQKEAVAAVLPILSWERFVRRRPQGSVALFSLLAAANSRQIKLHESGDVQPKQRRDEISAILTAADAANRRTLLTDYLRQQTLQILSLPPQTRVDEDEALHDMGLDSLMAVELRNSLVAAFEKQLPPTLVLDYPTLRTLTGFLLAEMFAGQAAQEKQPTNLHAISDDEAEALLLEELEGREHGAKR
jgi:acyl transferase domain-containing protein/NADPH:quinone reductase-like Zn-dependent oxidoreductase/short-subunit dehydrogenase/acyl carrier protein